MKDIKETVMKYVFLLCACASILAVVLINLYLLICQWYSCHWQNRNF